MSKNGRIEKILKYEYLTLVRSIKDEVVEPTCKGEDISNTLKDFVISDISGREEYFETFQDMSPDLKAAYQNLHDLVAAMKESKGDAMGILGEFGELFNVCNIYGKDYMRGLHDGVNMCRDKQYGMVEAITDYEQACDESEISKAAKSFINTCKRCPFKQE